MCHAIAQINTEDSVGNEESQLQGDKDCLILLIACPGAIRPMETGNRMADARGWSVFSRERCSHLLKLKLRTHLR